MQVILGDETNSEQESAPTSIAGVAERDVDLLLLEEFQSTPSFQDWFVAQALGQNCRLGKCIAAARSVTNFTGESDLEVVFMDRAKVRTVLMIENKVNAGLQPLQAQRYIERGQGYVASGKCSAFHTVLLAPKSYVGKSDGNKGFGSHITYEQVLDWFDKATELGERRKYKVTLLKSAIEKGTLGYQPIEDTPTTNFWRSYWLLTLKHAPELQLAEPSKKPSGSGFIYFRPRLLPKGVDIVHKFNRGYVDLQLRGMGNRPNDVRSILGPHFDSDMTLAAAAKSAAIRVQVPKLSASLGMAEQEQAARAGIDTAKRLLTWFLTHKAAWLSYSENAKT